MDRKSTSGARPLWVKSGLSVLEKYYHLSGCFRGKADTRHSPAEWLLSAISGHCGLNSGVILPRQDYRVQSSHRWRSSQLQLQRLLNVVSTELLRILAAVVSIQRHAASEMLEIKLV